jgi:CheY-like chemotaxis protein
MLHGLSNRELRVRHPGCLVADDDLIHARAGRTAPDGLLETRHRVLLASGRNLDCTVRVIAHPAADASAKRSRASEVPEPDALNPAANQVSSRDPHDRKAERLYWIPVPSPCPVLIVEDDADLREMMAQLLTLEGYQIETVANGREALEYLSDAPRPDVILLDLMMPIMDGWEFRKRQQNDPALADVPVIVLTALDQAQARASDLNGVDFLKKPLDFDRLLELVRRRCRQQP